MFKLILTGVGVFLCIGLTAQTIRGRVYRAGTDGVIPNASVYYSGSLTGTSTGAGGEFELPIKYDKIPLIVSCIGYSTAVINDYTPEDTLKVYLEVKPQQLPEVVIRADDGLPRADKERIFIREFLGTSEYARGCKIANIDDIDLVYSKKKQTFNAYCNSPIQIDNEKLGYRISYFLDGFTMAPGKVTISGNFLFIENKSDGNAKKIIRDRKDAYEGSRMQFIRALWADALSKANFSIYSLKYQRLSANQIVQQDKQQKYVNISNKIVIAYKNNKSTPSYLTQTLPSALISENGFYNTSLRWSGLMGMQRMGDLLPYEYKPEDE